jgi:hypothetical protein
MIKRLIVTMVLGSMMIPAFASTAYAEEAYGGDLIVAQEGCAMPEGTTYQPVLRKGNYGLNVEYVQSMVGAAPDGCFGPRTEQKVRDYQTRMGLYSDGVVGRCTWFTLTNGYVRSGCVSRSSSNTTSTTALASGKHIIISQRNNTVSLMNGSTLVEQLPMVDNPSVLEKGEYTISQFIRTNTDRSGRWLLPNFVRFNRGIGFHQIPLSAETGTSMHSESLLGSNSRVSGGCIRLSAEGSKGLWDFAKLGMSVFVT